MLYNRKKIDSSLILDVIRKFQDYKINIELFINDKLEDQRIVLVINNSALLFNNEREVFEYLQPNLKILEEQEEELQKRERIKRDLYIEVIDKVAKRYGQQVYSFSIGTQKND